MKGFFKVTSLVLAYIMVVSAAMVFAGTSQAPLYSTDKAVPFTGTIVTLSTTTTGTQTGPGVGNTVYFSMPLSIITCQKVMSNNTPSTSTILLQGSIDGGTTWNTLTSDISTGSTYTHLNTFQFTRLRSNWTVLTGATGTYTATVTCVGRQR